MGNENGGMENIMEQPLGGMGMLPFPPGGGPGDGNPPGNGGASARDVVSSHMDSFGM